MSSSSCSAAALRYSIAGMSVIVFGTALPCRATEAADVVPQQIEPIVVTATRSERSADHLPVSTTIITREELRAAPVQSLDDLLRNVAGVNLPFGDAIVQHPTANAISMRGLGGIRTLVLLDGVPINDAFFGFPQWNKVPKEIIERIEVVRGGSSNLYGSYALGGVINIITRKPGEREFAADAGYGTDGTTRINGYAAGAATDNLRLGANLNYFKTDGYIRTVPGERAAIDIAARSASKNAQFTARYDLDDTADAFFRGNYYANDANTGTPLSNNRQNIWDFATGIDNRFADDSELRANLFYQRDRFSTDNTSPSDADHPRSGEFLSNVHDTPTDDLGGSLIWSKTFTGLFRQALAGIDYRLIKGHDEARIFDTPSLLTRVDFGGGKQRSTGVFGQLSLFPLERLELLAGGRQDNYRNYSGVDDRPGGIGAVADKTSSQFSPKLAFNYRASEAVSVRGSAYRAFREPTLDNLYRTFAAGGFAIFPNAQLEPETLTGQELGVDVASGAFRGQATLFHNVVRNLIGSTVIANPPAPLFFALQEVNIGKVRSRGVELEGAWKLAERWSLSASYTYTDSIVVGNPGDPSVEGKQNADTPKQQASAAVRYGQTKGATAELRARYVGARFDPNASPALSRTLAAHVVADLFLSYPLHPKVEVFAIVENLFDREYIADTFSVDSRGAPRQLFGGVRLRFD